MREIRQSGSEGGGTELNRFSLPLSIKCHYVTGMEGVSAGKLYSYSIVLLIALERR
jgi:hypothetical protein